MKLSEEPQYYLGFQEKLPRTLKLTVCISTKPDVKQQYEHSGFNSFQNIAGYKIKKGWSINLDVVSIHHDPEVFPDPEKFDPSRFDVSSSNTIHYHQLICRVK